MQICDSATVLVFTDTQNERAAFIFSVKRFKKILLSLLDPWRSQRIWNLNNTAVKTSNPARQIFCTWPPQSPVTTTLTSSAVTAMGCVIHRGWKCSVKNLSQWGWASYHSLPRVWLGLRRLPRAVLGGGCWCSDTLPHGSHLKQLSKINVCVMWFWVTPAHHNILNSTTWKEQVYVFQHKCFMWCMVVKWVLFMVCCFIYICSLKEMLPVYELSNNSS